MEITILEKIENPLLNRTEIKFECDYPTEGTPNILDVKHKLIALEDSSKDLLVVDSMKPSYGEAKAVGLAKVYDSVEKLNEIETENNLYEINLTGNRMFDISINLKTIQSNIIKIKDSTKIENYNNLNENDKTLSGFFVKNLNEKLKNNEITEKEYEEIMTLGKSVLTK